MIYPAVDYERLMINTSKDNYITAILLARASKGLYQYITIIVDDTSRNALV